MIPTLRSGPRLVFFFSNSSSSCTWNEYRKKNDGRPRNDEAPTHRHQTGGRWMSESIIFFWVVELCLSYRRFDRTLIAPEVIGLGRQPHSRRHDTSRGADRSDRQSFSIFTKLLLDGVLIDVRFLPFSFRYRPPDFCFWLWCRFQHVIMIRH